MNHSRVIYAAFSLPIFIDLALMLKKIKLGTMLLDWSFSKKFVNPITQKF